MNANSRPAAALILIGALAACTNGSAPAGSMKDEKEAATVPDPQGRGPESATEQPLEPAAQSARPSSGPASMAGAEVASEPPLQDMALARPSGKIGVPVDVHYLVTGTVARDQPATLQLAFVPRVPGTAMKVEFAPADTVTVESTAPGMTVQKAEASGVYRRTLTVTPRKADTGELRAIVSMDVEGGRYFSVFTIPIGPGNAQAAPSRGDRAKAPAAPFR